METVRCFGNGVLFSSILIFTPLLFAVDRGILDIV